MNNRETVKTTIENLKEGEKTATSICFKVVGHV